MEKREWRTYFKLFIGFIIGVFIASFILKIGQGEGLSWETAVTLIIGGLVGLFLMGGIKAIINKAGEKSDR